MDGISKNERVSKGEDASILRSVSKDKISVKQFNPLGYGSQKGLIVQQFQEWSKGQVIYVKGSFRFK